jgi:hypothetical protein
VLAQVLDARYLRVVACFHQANWIFAFNRGEIQIGENITDHFASDLLPFERPAQQERIEADVIDVSGNPFAGSRN